MEILEFAKMFKVDIEIRYPDIDGNFMANITNLETKKDSILTHECGRGETPEIALRDYIEKISCKNVVFNAMNKDKRIDIIAPELSYTTEFDTGN